MRVWPYPTAIGLTVLLSTGIVAAAAGSKPHLTTARAKGIALSTVRQRTMPAAGVHFTVSGARLGILATTPVWFVHVRASATVFPCYPPLLTSGESGCQGAASNDAVVQIDDTNCRALSVIPTDKHGVRLQALPVPYQGEAAPTMPPQVDAATLPSAC